LSPEEQADWMAYKQNGDADAHQRLCDRYLGQVKRIVGRMEIYLGDGVLDREDLVQAGIIGLIDAIEKYDPARSVEFLAYARRRIRGAVYDELRALDELSSRSRRQKKSIYKAQDELQNRLQRAPTEEETADELGLSLQRFRSLRTALDVGKAATPTEEDAEPAFERPSNDSLRHWQQDADGLSPAEKFQLLAGKIEVLPERVKIVRGLYYRDGLTLKEIAEVLQLTESRICQIHAKALETLQRELSEIGKIFVGP